MRAVAPQIAAKLAAAGVDARRLVVAGTGAWVDRVRPLERAACLDQLGLNPARCYLGFLGKLSAWQGVDHAIEALSLLRRSYPEVDLLVVGDGPERQRLAEHAADIGLAHRVHFLKAVPPSAVAHVLGAFDIALAPKTTTVAYNGMAPLKVRDYAAAGRPVVAPDVPGFGEFQAQGWLATYPAHQPSALAAVLEDLIADPVKRAHMVTQARRFAVARFDWLTVLGPLIERIEEAQRSGCR